MKTAVVIGVGPERGLGGYLCMGAASQGLHVVVAGRTREKLDAVVASIESAGGEGTGVVCDTRDESAVIALVAQAEAIAPLDLAIYNAGNNMPGNFLEMEAGYFEQCWRVGCFGGFLFARETLKAMVPRQTGCLIFTGRKLKMGYPNGIRNWVRTV